MRNIVFALSLLLAGAPATAAGIGPEIAYVKAGAYSEIYLVNPDGSALRRVYRAALRTRIFQLDMKPGGGELAIEEADTQGGRFLTVIRYDELGRLQSKSSIQTCQIGSIDYHPTNSELLYADLCQGAVEVKLLNTQTMTAIGTGIVSGEISWRGSDHVLFNQQTSATDEIWSVPLANLSGAEKIGDTRLVQSMDLSTAGDRLLIDNFDFGTLDMFSMSLGTAQTDWQIGSVGRFSPDDLQVVYVTGYDVRGQYVMIRNVTGPGSPFRLAGKAAFGPVDWRN